MEDIYATRSFTLVSRAGEDGGTHELTGLTFDQPLKAGVNEAQCPHKRAKHKVPHPGCTCGFYCYDDPEGSLWPGKRQSRESVVDAVVRISGRVAVHESGLRAQYLEVVAFGTSDDDEREVLTTLFPSVPIFNTLDSALTKFPVTALERDEKLARPSILGLVINVLMTFVALIGVPILLQLLFFLPDIEGVSEHFETRVGLRLIYPGVVAFVMLSLGAYFKGFEFPALYVFGRILEISSGFILLSSFIATGLLAINPDLHSAAEALVLIVGMLTLLVVRLGGIILAFGVALISILPGDNVNLRRQPESFKLPTKLKDSATD